MNLQPLLISETFSPSALDTTAHILAYTVITYILFLNMDNSLGWGLYFISVFDWKLEGVTTRFGMYGLTGKTTKAN
jgi:hypothetical protein